MGPVLKGLINLQSVENRLRAAKVKLHRVRRAVIIQENQVRTLQNTLDAKHEDIQLTQIQSDRLELELKSREEEVQKLRNALNNAKSNKEYAAILTQLNTSRADNSKLETQVLDLMKDIEADKADSEKIKIEIEAQKEKLEQTRKDSEQMAEKYENDIEKIQQQWDEASAELPAEALEVFNRVANTYDGEALAFAEPHDGKNQNFSCGGCFMGLTAESINMLMTKDEIIRCPNCTRILVLEHDHS